MPVDVVDMTFATANVLFAALVVSTAGLLASAPNPSQQALLLAGIAAAVVAFSVAVYRISSAGRVRVP